MVQFLNGPCLVACGSCVCRFHNQYLVLDALVRQAQALVEGVFVQKLKTMRMEEAERKAESKSAHLTEEELAAQERKLRRAEDALERTYHVALERTLIETVMSSDHKGRTLLHYAACSKGLSVERLLDTGAGADFDARSASGRRLFPRKGHFCAQCGYMVKQAGGFGDDARPTTPSRRGFKGAAPSPGRRSLAPSVPASSPGRKRKALKSRKPQPKSLAAKLAFKGRPARDGPLGASATLGASALSGTAGSGQVPAPLLTPGKGAAPGDAVSDAPLCGRCHVAAVTVATLKAHRADVVNTPDAQGGTPLHYASAIGDVRACKSLLRHGADRCGVVLPPWERVVAWFA